MFTARRTLATLLIVLYAVTITIAQDSKSGAPPSTALTVTVAATAERVRFTAPSTVVRMHLEVYSETGETLFDGGNKGNVFDWTLADSSGQRVADGSYLCVVTAKTLGGKIGQRMGLVAVQDKQVSVRGALAAQLSAAQQQAVGPVEENSALTVLREGDTPAATVIGHDGHNGQVTSTTGALTFRTGNVFSGQDTEQMRLTEEGNLGIGTEQPEARLDVNGMVRARSGFQFSDGSVLDVSPKGGGLRVTLPGGKSLPVNLAPNAVAATQNKIPKFADAGGSLTDSNIFEDASGRVGIGTTTPQHPFSVRRNGGTLGVHTLGELFVDRDDRTRSASMVLGTAGTLKWIFGMPYQDDGFQIFDLLASPVPGVSRFYVHPTSGNIGIGTNTPTSKLVVVPGGSGGEINFGTPGGETGMGIIGTNRADVRFDGTTLKLVAGLGSGAAPSTNGLAISTAGNVGIGTNAPGFKLEVNAVGTSIFGKSSGASAVGVYGESQQYNGVRGIAFNVNHGAVVGLHSGNGIGVYGETAGACCLVTGVFGKSTSSSGVGVIGESATGVYGRSTTNSGIGVKGEGLTGLYGNSTIAGGNGVTGIGTTGVRGETTGGTGVYGMAATATGYGVFANNPVGIALGVGGNASQNRDKGGLVKALLYVNGSGNILRCFNALRQDGGSGTPGCGFSINNYANGRYEINFGFQVDDRFVAVTAQHLYGGDDEDFNTGANFRFTGTNQINVYTFSTDELNDTSLNSFMIVVF